jgi:hypothetical protein
MTMRGQEGCTYVNGPPEDIGGIMRRSVPVLPFPHHFLPFLKYHSQVAKHAVVMLLSQWHLTTVFTALAVAFSSLGLSALSQTKGGELEE